jgi:hypothetical protein
MRTSGWKAGVVQSGIAMTVTAFIVACVLGVGVVVCLWPIFVRSMVCCQHTFRSCFRAWLVVGQQSSWWPERVPQFCVKRALGWANAVGSTPDDDVVGW